MVAKKPQRFAVARAHPFISLGTIGAILTILGALGSFGYFLFNAVESTASAERREAGLRAEIKAEVAELRKEAAGRVIANARLATWGSVQTKRIEVLVLRNRVNDCRAAKLQSSLERNACKQYEDEFAEATASYQRLQKEAIDASKDKP